MSGSLPRFTQGLACAQSNGSGTSLRDQSGADHHASVRPIGHWSLAWFLVLPLCLRATFFGFPATLSSPAPKSTLGQMPSSYSGTASSGVVAFQSWAGAQPAVTSDIFDSADLPLKLSSVPKPLARAALASIASYAEVDGLWTHFHLTVPRSFLTATLSGPAPGSVLSGSSATFSWNPIAGATTYQLLLGLDGQGSSSVYNSGPIAAHSVTVSGLPTKGASLYATLYSQINGIMVPAYSIYTESSEPAPAAVGAFACNSSSVSEIGMYSCTVTLSAAAASGGETVTISTSSVAITLPTVVTVPGSATSAVFMADVVSLAAAQTVTLTATAGGVTKSFSIQLIPPSITLGINSTSVSFGNVAINTASTQSITLTAAGNEPVVISAATVTGTGFTLPGATFPITLSPGQSMSLSVQFEPQAIGAATGELTISSDASANSTAQIALSGAGISYTVALSWDAPATSPVPVVGYNIYRSPGGSSAYELVNSAVATQTAYTDSTVQSGQAYDYIVESVDGAGVESAPSITASVEIP